MASGPELSDLQKLELKEAFDEFDKVIQMTSKLYNNQFSTAIFRHHCILFHRIF